MGSSPSHFLLGLLCLLLRISEYSELAGVKTIFMITSKETTANGVARVALQKVARWCLSYQVKQKTNRNIFCQEIAPSRRVLRWAITNQNYPPQIPRFHFSHRFHEKVLLNASATRGAQAQSAIFRFHRKTSVRLT